MFPCLLIHSFCGSLYPRLGKSACVLYVKRDLNVV